MSPDLSASHVLLGNDAILSARSVVHPEKLKGCSVLVIGASGLIGSHVVTALHELNHLRGLGIQITAAARHSERLFQLFSSFADVDCRRMDVTDRKSVDSLMLSAPTPFNIVIDCASMASPHLFDSYPVETMEGNINGVRYLLSALVSSVKSFENSSSSFPDIRQPRFCFISSGEVYGYTHGWHLMKEEEQGFVDLLNPRSCYPMAKRASETLVASFAKEYALDTVIVRPSHVFGPGFLPSDNRVSADFFQRGHAKQPIRLRSAGSDHRTYIYVSDCAAAILSAIAVGESGEAINITNSKNLVSLREFSRKIAKAAGVEFAAPAVPQESTENAAARWQRASALDDSKLRSLGFVPQISLDDGIRRTFQQLR